MIGTATFRHRYLIFGASLTPIALVVAAASAGGGHGSYAAARALLPFACLVLGDYGGAALIVSTMAVIQWPIYGWILDRATLKVWAGAGIAIAHLGICVWLFEKGTRWES